MKEGNNSKNYGSIVIPKAREIQTSLFCVSTPREREDTRVSLPYVGQAVCHCFFFSSHVFVFAQLLGKA